MASPCLGGLWLDTVSDRTIEQEAAGRGFAARRRFREAEAAARAVNAEAWEPMPGMVKRQCPECRYWFAAPASSQEARCQDCLDKLPRGIRR